MVHADRRPQCRAPPLAIRGSRGASGTSRAELERARVGRYGAQDGAPDSEDEQQDHGTHAVESDRVSSTGWEKEKLLQIPGLGVMVRL